MQQYNFWRKEFNKNFVYENNLKNLYFQDDGRVIPCTNTISDWLIRCCLLGLSYTVLNAENKFLLQRRAVLLENRKRQVYQ